MNIENIRKLTPYQEINGLLSDWVEGVKNILGGNVVGLYLSGSLSYGGFVLERSDIDLQAVWRRTRLEKSRCYVDKGYLSTVGGFDRGRGTMEIWHGNEAER